MSPSGTAVEQINQITANIAQVNIQLSAMPNAPELMDKRDELLRELSQYTDVTVIEQGDSNISVGIGSGEMLVIGSEQRELKVDLRDSDQFGTKIFITKFRL